MFGGRWQGAAGTGTVFQPCSEEIGSPVLNNLNSLHLGAAEKTAWEADAL